MRQLIAFLVISISTSYAFSFCKAEGLQTDIETIRERTDITWEAKQHRIRQAKRDFKYEVIECALNNEPISKQAQALAKKYILEDETTRPEEAQALLKRIDQNSI